MTASNKKIKPPTLGQKKLAALNLSLPLLPTTTIGSFPKTPELTEFRFKVQQGVLPASELERKERIATDLWLREQSRLSLSVFVGGEMDRGDTVWHFANQIQGFELGGLVRIWGNRFAKRPVIKSKLTWKGPITVEQWQLTQRATHSPVKAILTSPYAILDSSFNEYYPTRESALEDLTSVMRKELNLLVEAGAKIIQIDDPALCSRPDEFSLVADSFRELVKGFKCYTILHHCYDDRTLLWPKIEKLPIDNFSFDGVNSNFKILTSLKRHPTSKDITLGVIDSLTDAAESPRSVAEAITSALKVIPSAQLWISPDCGLKTITTEHAIEKLGVMVSAAAKIRNGIK